MENAYGVDPHKIRVGDRVKVAGCVADESESYWGKVSADAQDGDWYVNLDAASIQAIGDRSYRTYSEEDPYLAYGREVVVHLPAAVEEPHVCHTMMPPMPYTDPRLGKVAADINETLRYLWARTGSEWVAETDGIQLDISAEGDYAGTLHVKFIKKEIE